MNNQKRFRIIYVLEKGLHPECLKYRAYNIKEYTKHADFNISFIYINSLADKTLYSGIVNSDIYTIVVLYRVKLSSLVERFIRDSKVAGKILIYDIDDYLFDETILPKMGFLNHWPIAKQKQYVDNVMKIKRCLLLCHYYIATNNFLKKAAESLGVKSYVIQNGINAKELRQAQYLENVVSARGNTNLTIGYISGSFMHQEDFVMIQDVLRKILSKHPGVTLKIMGVLKVPSLLKKEFGDRIKNVGFLSWKNILRAYTKIDVNIYPLVNNDFNNSRSETKYLGAALLRVPTIVSNTSGYRDIIINGQNGFLAESEDDWEKRLESLLTSRALREQIGENAYRDVVQNYYYAMPQKITKVFDEIVSDFEKTAPHPSIQGATWTENGINSALFRIRLAIHFFIFKHANLLRFYLKKNLVYRLPYYWQGKLFYWVEKLEK
jgi:glycosyltransferase involved in cell wall biosynthesis